VATTFWLATVAIFSILALVCYALYRKGDVRAVFKLPMLFEFSIDAKDKKSKST
jgi:hypothetical protein